MDVPDDRYRCPVCEWVSGGQACENPNCDGVDQKLSKGLPNGVTWLDRARTLDSITVKHVLTCAKTRPAFAILPNGCLILDPAGIRWMSLAKWKNGPTPGWLPGWVRFNRRRIPHDVAVTLRGSADVRVHFSNPQQFRDYQGSSITRTDLRYHEIGSIFRAMGNPQAVAREMLLRVQGEARLHFGIYDQFVDAMIVLMFAVEGSRNWATLATAVMTLELIEAGATYGSSNTKTFDLEGAFHHRTDKRWSDGSTFFGGKFPMATHGTGPGNFVERGQILQGFRSPDEVLSQPRHHAVLVREISIFRHWLALVANRDPYTGKEPEECVRLLLHAYYPP